MTCFEFQVSSLRKASYSSAAAWREGGMEERSRGGRMGGAGAEGAGGGALLT